MSEPEGLQFDCGKGRYRAFVVADDKTVELGYYRLAEEALRVRDAYLRLVEQNNNKLRCKPLTDRTGCDSPFRQYPHSPPRSPSQHD